MIRSNGVTTLADVINMSVGKKSENAEMYMSSDKEGQSGKCGKKQMIFLGTKMKEIEMSPK